MSQPPICAPSLICFGVFELDLEAGELRKNGLKVKLEGQPIQVLQFLLERPGRVVSRDELQQKLWPSHTFVDFEQGINSAMKRLRHALDDSADTPRFIETLPRRGYRFIYPLEGAALEVPQAPVWWRCNRRMALLLISLPALFVGLLALNPAGLRNRLFRARAGSPITSLAVLPLENLTGDADQQHSVDGIHDELIEELAHFRSLKVISRTSVLRYKQGGNKPLREIAQELGVGALVEGTVQRAGDRVHLNVQMVDAASDRHLWAQSYEADISDILDLQRDVARDIANQLRIRLAPQDQVRPGAELAPAPADENSPPRY